MESLYTTVYYSDSFPHSDDASTYCFIVCPDGILPIRIIPWVNQWQMALSIAIRILYHPSILPSLVLYLSNEILWEQNHTWYHQLFPAEVSIYCINQYKAILAKHERRIIKAPYKITIPEHLMMVLSARFVRDHQFPFISKLNGQVFPLMLLRPLPKTRVCICLEIALSYYQCVFHDICYEWSQNACEY